MNTVNHTVTSIIFIFVKCIKKAGVFIWGIND